jgi:hypothetical protein
MLPPFPPSGWIIPLSSSGVRFTRNDNSAGKMKKISLFLAENNLFFSIFLLCREDQISDDDGCQACLDAGHILQVRSTISF